MIVSDDVAVNTPGEDYICICFLPNDVIKLVTNMKVIVSKDLVTKFLEMSVILIKQHNENIYRATKKVAMYYKKEPRYISRYLESIKLVNQKIKRYPHATMGLPERPLPEASNFLKKKCGIRYKVQPNYIFTPKQCSAKSPVIATSVLLKEDEERKKKQAPTRNFVQVNIKKSLKLLSKTPEKRIVINCYGTTKKMSAGMEPVYIYKVDYGRIPDYLSKFIRARERDEQLKRDSIGTEQPKCIYVTKEQREQLLEGLKQNWEELQKIYQGLPILIDTLPKMQRKVKLEEALKLLERDIVLIEKHPYIYVYNDK
ncbi:hypothetical protein FQA39_LY17311 [Lamprigera yunnana]|nr:hypothetical protein FQA39_LY17311 [Lamprigera yunnana]